MSRSWYLDDMSVRPGQMVKCRACVGPKTFTPGKIYVVIGDGQLFNDKGELVIPSARFTYV